MSLAAGPTLGAVAAILLVSAVAHSLLRRPDRTPRLAMFALLLTTLAGPPGADVGAAASDTAPRAYTIIDLGTLPELEDHTRYFPAALNGIGQVAGTALTSSAQQAVPLLYSNGTLTRLTAPTGTLEAEAHGINAGGAVAGWVWDGQGGISAYAAAHAALWQGSVLIDLHPAGSSGSHAFAIDDAGRAVGYTIGPDTTAYPHPVRWQGGGPVDLTPFGEDYGIAYATTAGGHIAGVSGPYPGGSHATIWREGFATNLGVPDGFGTSTALALNASDQVVGYAEGGTDAFFWSHALLWQGGTITDLGTLGGVNSRANGINTAGQIVGSADAFGQGAHAALWQDRRVIDLNGRIPADAGWTLLEATAINDAGQIVGYGFRNERYRAFLLTPTDGPGRLVNLTLTSAGGGDILATAPGPTYPVGTAVSLAARPMPGALFTGWTIDGAPAGWANPLTLTLDVDRVVAATFVAQPAFTDVLVGNQGAEAVAQLAARAVAHGYGDGRFGPDDPLLRAQVAALIVRAMPGWSGETGFNDFTDPIPDDELWARVGTLRRYFIARGYQDEVCRVQGKAPPCFGPLDTVKYGQGLLFITRAMVAKGYWRYQLDDPALFPDLSGTTNDERTDRAAIITYVHYAGAPPDVSVSPGVAFRVTGVAAGGWGDTSSRGWFARALWQALDAYFSQDLVP